VKRSKVGYTYGCKNANNKYDYGFEDVKPMVLLEFTLLIQRIMKICDLDGKLQLNDASLVFCLSSAALGFGFR
jgi:translation elongation factor EF-4